MTPAASAPLVTYSSHLAYLKSKGGGGGGGRCRIASQLPFPLLPPGTTNIRSYRYRDSLENLSYLFLPSQSKTFQLSDCTVMSLRWLPQQCELDAKYFFVWRKQQARNIPIVAKTSHESLAYIIFAVGVSNNVLYCAFP